jgi:hypothetical protein
MIVREWVFAALLRHVSIHLRLDSKSGSLRYTNAISSEDLPPVVPRSIFTQYNLTLLLMWFKHRWILSLHACRFNVRSNV